MTSRELLLEFLKFHYKQNPLRKQETNEKDIENFMAELPADFETKNASLNICVSDSLPADFDSILDIAETDGWSFYKGKWSRDGYRSRGSGELYDYIKGNDR